mmetsp:Transcript_26293/g.57042  ORF Transcript_26293/g.57042 Transcript_26293/m.57042 type:complete len:456 (-) Transcript_26293:61-1428(-)
MSFGGARVIGNKITTNHNVPEGWGNNAPTDPKWKMGGSEERPDSCLVVMEPDTTLNLKQQPVSTRTYIQMFKRVEELVDEIKKQPAEKLQKMMGLSEKTAKSHADRFQNFHKLPPKQMALILGGDALAADDLDSAEMKYFENHLRFVSGLYGVLRPWDDVKPVRDVLPSAALKTKKGDTVLEFWGDAVSKQIQKDATAGNGKVPMVLLLLSDEYIPLLQLESFPKEIRVIRAVFEGASDSEVRRARQKLGRFIMRRKLTCPADLELWEPEDWRVDKFKTTGEKIVFMWIAGDGIETWKDKKSKKSKKSKDKKDKDKKKDKGKSSKKKKGSSGSGSSRSRSASKSSKSKSKSKSRSKSSKSKSKSREEKKGTSKKRKERTPSPSPSESSSRAAAKKRKAGGKDKDKDKDKSRDKDKDKGKGKDRSRSRDRGRGSRGKEEEKKKAKRRRSSSSRSRS